MGKDKSASNSPSPPRRPPRPQGVKPNPWTERIVKLVSVLFLPVLFGYFGYQMHEQFVILPAIISTKSPLPTVLAPDAFTPAQSPELYWGSYRSNLYFGMRTRSPKSPVVGLMWYEQPRHNSMMPRIRHWCDQGDNLGKYGWSEHDGRTFGIQDIEDDRIVVRTEFVKRPGGKHGGDWTARISAKPSARATPDAPSMHSFIIYLALGDIGADGSYVRPYSAHDKQLGGQFVDKVDGYTPELGKFVLRFANGKNVVARSFLAARVEPEPDLRKMKELLISGTKVFELKSEKPEQETVQHLGLMGYVPENAPPTDKPNILLVQVTFTDSTSLDVIFESGSVENRPGALTGGVFDKLLAERSKAFHDKFEKTFGLVAKGYPEFYQTMGQYALCNMVGSIGYFYGSNHVQGPYNSQPVPYGPHALFATVPSRPFFPRGFLWDEGFHHLLLRKFDSELSLEILGSWLDLMNVEGWIPREMILGAEAEHKVPAEFVVQRNSVANPPMFFYLLSRYLAEEKFADKHAAYLEKVYPRLKAWYGWLNRTQSGREPGTYRWRGRNATTDLELNPKTLPSGLDDYPRASHPTDEEYHLDLVCWMSVSSKVMAELSERVKDADHAAFEATAKKLSDIEHLDAKHWSEKTGRYCDFGMHTRHVKLVKPAPVMGPDGRPRPPPRPDMTREVLRAPTARLITDTFGYVSLFPLFLRLIPADSPKLGRILEQLTDADLLWTSFGLRSLARTSPLYSARNTEHDPPYWRGSVWMNMNFLALSSLKHYSTVTGPHQATAFKVYSELRGAVVANVAREFKRTGFLWEHYNDETGHGEGTHPFTGWTSLVLLMMSEQYD